MPWLTLPEHQLPRSGLSIDDADVIALKALAFLMGSEDRASRFVRLTGIDPDATRERMQDRQFLAGVIEHLLADESLLVLFSQDNAIDPGLPARAAALLRGGHAV